MASIPGSMASKILILNASPKRDGHTHQLLKAALDALSGLEECSANYYSMADAFDQSTQESNRFETILDQWEQASAIILGAPVYTFGPPSFLYEFFKLLIARHKKKTAGCIKPIGIVAQGGGAYSGAEITSQVLMNLALSAGCSPVSGDMPGSTGSSQGFIGQISDAVMVTTEQLHAVSRLSIRVLEMAQILACGDKKQKPSLKILGVSSGLTAGDKHNQLLKSAFAIMHESYPNNLETELFDFSGKDIEPCRGCTQYCSSDLECVYHDSMQDFRKRWLTADAILWAVNANDVDPGLVAVIDRMNQVRFETFFATQQQHMPRYLKAAAIFGLGQSGEYFSSMIQFLRHTAVLYQNILITIGNCGVNNNRVIDDPMIQRSFCTHFLERSVEIKTGLNQLIGKLPGEYYPSLDQYARLRLE